MVAVGDKVRITVDEGGAPVGEIVEVTRVAITEWKEHYEQEICYTYDGTPNYYSGGGCWEPVESTVERPAHYTFGKYEVIDVIADWGLNFNRGSALKYIARAGRKDPSKEVEDLQKAVKFLTHEIERLS